MTKRTRLTILLACVVLFFTLTPAIVGYSLGYRFDLKHKKIVATGGIYVRALPQGADIAIDLKVKNKTGIFYQTVFAQNLVPGEHNVSIKKDGYFDYQKTLEVKEKEVTKLENVILFKQNIAFETLPSTVQSPFSGPKQPEKFILKNNNLYYSDILENVGISATIKNTQVLKNVAGFQILNNNILWAGANGLVYNSDASGKLLNAVSKTELAPIVLGSPEFFIFSNKIYLLWNDTLLFIDQEKNESEPVYNPVKNAKISPDNRQILIFNDYEILLYPADSNASEKIFLNRFSEKINDCFWLNNDYIIYGLENKIEISEIDLRGNMNTVVLPDKLAATGNSEIFFNQQEGKLYILTDNTVYVSEKLTP